MGAVMEIAKCRLCGVTLDPDAGDDFTRAVCGDCKSHPAARRLGAVPKPGANACGARAFTLGEKALIRKVHGYMPAAQLLDLLNERLLCDLGPDASKYTMSQLHAETQDAAGPGDAGDWASVRKLLAKARKSGVLDLITAQSIDDFAVVFSLSSAQVLRLKDVVLTAKENER